LRISHLKGKGGVFFFFFVLLAKKKRGGQTRGQAEDERANDPAETMEKKFFGLFFLKMLSGFQ